MPDTTQLRFPAYKLPGLTDAQNAIYTRNLFEIERWSHGAGNHYHDGTGTNSTALGQGSTATVDEATAIGDRATATGLSTIALGIDASASRDLAIAIGSDANAEGQESIVIGWSAKSLHPALYGIAIGKLATVSGAQDLIAIGRESSASSSSGAMAIGTSAVASAGNTISIGTSATTNQADTIVIGASAIATAGGSGNVVIGTSADAKSKTRSVALGESSVATASTQVHLGDRHIEIVEITAPANGAANSARLFAVDSGGGKTELRVIFGSGASQLIATEP